MASPENPSDDHQQQLDLPGFEGTPHTESSEEAPEQKIEQDPNQYRLEF